MFPGLFCQFQNGGCGSVSKMKLLFRRGRKKHQEVVRFNVTVEILSIEGLPVKYSHFRVQLQRGRKSITSGDLHAEEGRVRRTETLQFTSSMQRAASGIEFEDKDYKLNLLRVNPRSTSKPTKVVTQTWLRCAPQLRQKPRKNGHKKVVLVE